MPSFQDSAFIFFLALLLFGPKKLPELARYVGKLMAEFRRASYEFRSQMDEEFRAHEQAEQQKKIAAIEAAVPLAPAQNIPDPEHPHNDACPASEPDPQVGFPALPSGEDEDAVPAPPDRSYPPAEVAAELVPIATSGDLHIMPPSTGLPVSRSASSNPQPVHDSSIAGIFDSIPHAPEPEPAPETTTHA